MFIRIIVGIWLATVVMIGSGGISPTVSAATSMEPDYAKWGSLAMRETVSKYKAEVIDYKYEGHFASRGQMSEERFLLLLRKENKQFGVRVKIHVHDGSSTAESIEFEEVK